MSLLVKVSLTTLKSTHILNSNMAEKDTPALILRKNGQGASF